MKNLLFFVSLPSKQRRESVTMLMSTFTLYFQMKKFIQSRLLVHVLRFFPNSALSHTTAASTAVAAILDHMRTMILVLIVKSPDMTVLDNQSRDSTIFPSYPVSRHTIEIYPLRTSFSIGKNSFPILRPCMM